MPPAPKLSIARREARILARKEYGPAPLQIRYAPERALPSRNTPLQVAFDLTTSIAPPPPSVGESALTLWQSKIPKPPGEVSRPARGGYSLEKTLDWSKDTYAKFQEAVRVAAEPLPLLLHSDQKKSDLKAICTTIRTLFPILEDYEADWPTHACLTTHLKNRRTRKSPRPRGDESELTELSEDDGRMVRKKTKRKDTVVSRDKHERKTPADETRLPSIPTKLK